ncbi:MAG TPA: YtxH domain-containing protein [Acidimicrobiales bacterium]|nr:YtxH domain-containing protein [Acidimicrobiales bacterium]
MFLFRLLFSPVKIVLFVARVLGYNRLFLFLLGVAVGLLVAPTTGAEMRRRLQEEVEKRMDRVAEPVTPAQVAGEAVTPEV